MATVLVVDDEHGVAELLDAILTEKGYRVLTAFNGKRGLEVLSQECADLIFLNFMMPVMGAPVVLALMMADPVWQKIPVVVVSGLPKKIIAAQCGGYAHILTKPFQISQVEGLTERLTA